MGKGRMFLSAKPRQMFAAEKEPAPDAEWTLANSFFGKYKADDDDIINKCFDFDWGCSSLDKLIKDLTSRQNVKNFLRPRYKMIREAYKHLACIAPSGNIPSIGMITMAEILLKCNDLVDNKNLKLSDVDISFIATNSTGSR